MLRLRPGEAAPNIQSLRDIRRGAGAPSLSLGSAAVDSTIREQTSAMLVARAYPSAARLHRPWASHLQYDAVEEQLGLSRTFRVAVAPDVDVRDLSARLLDLDAVESASPMYLSETPFMAPKSREPSARPDAPYELIGADRALALEPGDGAVLLGLVDSGVALAHPELDRCLRPGVDTVALDAEAMPVGMKLLTRSTALRQQTWADDEGHGTGCTSIMAARGLSMHPGVAGDNALVIPAKALAAVETAEGGGVSAIGSLPDIDHALKLVIDLGARVINLSFGTPASALDPHDPIPHEEIVRYALARGCILVAASGNNGDDDPFYPAALPGVIAVGAVDGQGRPSTFSSYGPHVALCAPGEGIQLAALSGYAMGAGTSFAAPFVTAASALLLARALRQSTPLDSDGVRRILCRSARPFARGLGTRGCGAGILDIPAALRAVDDEISAGALASEGGLSTPRNTGSLQPTSH
jgi:subtilisin family serine protease